MEITILAVVATVIFFVVIELILLATALDGTFVVRIEADMLACLHPDTFACIDVTRRRASSG